MRDNTWLFHKLDEVWDGHFSDIPQHNDVIIKFGRKARQRLGSIKQEAPIFCHLLGGLPRGRLAGDPVEDGKHRKSIITINGLFKDPEIPEYVVTATIAHEMCHYAHGFSSPLEQKYPNPHLGGIVTKEMKARGFAKELKLQKQWLKETWPKFLKSKMPERARRRRRKRLTIKWI